MGEVKWIKIVTNIFDNKKIRIIESMPDGDAIIVIWLKLLILAGNTNDNGCVYFTKDIPYTDQMLATLFARPLTTTQMALKTFEEFGMIEIVDEIIQVSNWERYQNVEGMEKIREQNRLRVAKHRENKRLAQKENKEEKDVTLRNVTDRYNVTQCNALDIDIDIDIDKDINPPLPPLGGTGSSEYDFSKHTNRENVKNLLNSKTYKDWEYIKSNPSLWTCIKDWMEYKDSRKPKAANHYVNAKSITTLLNKFVSSSREYGVDEVIRVVEDSMASSYMGIVWDKLTKENKSKTDWGKIK